MQQLLSRKLSILMLAALLTHGSVSTINATSNSILLTSKVLKFLDGVAHAIDGHTILDMKIISNKLRTLVHGHLDADTKKRTGILDFQDKKASLHMLARIEERIQATFKTAREELEKKYLDTAAFGKKWHARELALIDQYDEQVEKIEEEMILRHKGSEEARDIAIKQAKRAIFRKHALLLEEEIELVKKAHIKDFAAFSKELTELENKRAHQMELLVPALDQAKKEFANITFQYMEQARGAKDFMVPLIEEWADKAGHKDSMLLRWSEEAVGSELSMFDQDICNCTRLDGMCNNLLDFLSSMIASCPKAVEQYETLKNKLTHTP